MQPSTCPARARAVRSGRDSGKQRPDIGPAAWAAGSTSAFGANHGTMKPLFDRIHACLARHAPLVLDDLRPPAAPKRIRAAEKAMGLSFPEDVKAAYLVHDGQ